MNNFRKKNICISCSGFSLSTAIIYMVCPLSKHIHALRQCVILHLKLSFCCTPPGISSSCSVEVLLASFTPSETFLARTKKLTCNSRSSDCRLQPQSASHLKAPPFLPTLWLAVAVLASVAVHGHGKQHGQNKVIWWSIISNSLP